MSRKGPSAPRPLPVVLGLGVLLLAAGAFLFGAREAMVLARASMERVFADGAVAHRTGASIPGLVVVTDGGTGSAEGACHLVHEGVTYPGRLRGGEDAAWWLDLDSISPFSGIRSLRLSKPDEPSRIAWKASLDMAAILGSATARLEVVPCVVDGVPLGLLHWGEEIGPDVERLRGLHGRPVPVFHGPDGDPWASKAEWSSMGNVPGTSLAEARLHGLLGLLQDRDLPDSLWTDSLSRLVDAEAFLRLRVWEDLLLDGRRIVPVLVAGDPSGRLYPLIGAFPRFLPDSLRSVGPADRLLQVPGERVRYDSLRQECLDLLLARGAWKARVSELAEGLAPHVARDRAARFVLPETGAVPVRTSVLDWESAVQELLQRTPPQDHGS